MFKRHARRGWVGWPHNLSEDTAPGSTTKTLTKRSHILWRRLTVHINHVIIHARKAILGGLSPKQNRKIPPLNYDLVYQMKKNFPKMEIILNGGLKTLEQCKHELQTVDGVMVGRAAYRRHRCYSKLTARFSMRTHLIRRLSNHL